MRTKFHKMKKYLIILFLSILNLGCVSAQKLDYSDPFKNEIYFQDGRTKITKENLTKYFEDILAKQGNTTKISSFKLLNEKDESTQNNYDMIVGYNNDNSIKIANKLAPYDGGIYVLAGTTVTCKGCTRGCNPRQFGSDWECTDCTWNGACEKTVTTTSP